MLARHRISLAVVRRWVRLLVRGEVDAKLLAVGGELIAAGGRHRGDQLPRAGLVAGVTRGDEAQRGVLDAHRERAAPVGSGGPMRGRVHGR